MSYFKVIFISKRLDVSRVNFMSMTKNVIVQVCLVHLDNKKTPRAESDYVISIYFDFSIHPLNDQYNYIQTSAIDMSGNLSLKYANWYDRQDKFKEE